MNGTNGSNECSIRRSAQDPGIEYRTNDGPIWLSNVECTGSETFLSQCSPGTLGYTYNCGHNNDVMVRCNPPATPDPSSEPPEQYSGQKFLVFCFQSIDYGR